MDSLLCRRDEHGSQLADEVKKQQSKIKFHALHVDDSTIQSSCAVLCRDHCVSIPEHHGRPRLSTAVGIRPQPSLPSTAVSSCSFPSTAATVVRGRPQPSRPSTAMIAVHGCPRLLRPPTAVGRPADCLTRVILKMLTRCRPF